MSMEGVIAIASIRITIVYSGRVLVEVRGKVRGGWVSHVGILRICYAMASSR